MFKISMAEMKPYDLRRLFGNAFVVKISFSCNVTYTIKTYYSHDCLYLPKTNVLPTEDKKNYENELFVILVQYPI